ncbi:hypothetical protein N0V87_001513 [Didymella glomerata]|uniref:Uncharacterized protein n=1 Tax=Didymella glomerata TaxID=749621 RepID=A0A9W8X5R2_9PLEO|nr:hypothetical protein N0V87_001513 [Didymella glomerata]
MECASRSLAFHSYQTSQEIIYQEHLAKGLTDKYNVLSQHMDQLIHDANSQIKVLQDKVQEKAKTLARQKKMYDTLKGRVMASHVAVAAGDEAEMTLQTVRATDRFADRMPGVRTGTGMYGKAAVALSAVGSSEVVSALGLPQAILNIYKGVGWAVEFTLVVSACSM